MDYRPGQQVANCSHVPQERGESSAILRYWLFVPAAYDARSVGWPLLLFLHGVAESGDIARLENVKRHGPPKLVECQPEFPFIVVSPQCPQPTGPHRDGWNIDRLAMLLDELLPNLRIDPSRIYITGLSSGGFGTWRMVARYPDRFAAAVPICGGGDPQAARQIAQVPIWCFHGEDDPVVPVDSSEKMVDAVLQAGGQVRFTIYPHVGHDAWSRSYADPELYQWLLAHSKTTMGDCHTH